MSQQSNERLKLVKERLQGGQSAISSILESGEIDTEKRTAVLSFSSETPVERWFGWEILSHGEDSQRHERIKAGGSLLDNHDIDKRLGGVIDVWLKDGRGYALVKFSRNKAGDDAFRDVQDGILSNVSFRYEYDASNIILKERAEDREDGKDVFIIPSHEVLEISLVSIPADYSVGIGRSFDDINNKKPETKTIKTENNNSKQEKTIMTIESGNNAQDFLEMIEVGNKFGKEDLAKSFIEKGKGIDELREEILRTMEQDNKNQVRNQSSDDLGLSQKEIKSYSLSRAIHAAKEKNWRGAEFELEVSKAAQAHYKKDCEGFLVPPSVLRSKAYQARNDAGNNTIMVGNAGNGGPLIGTDLQHESFISLLQNRLVMHKLGIRTLDNLKDNVAIPKQTAGTKATWIGEGEAANKTSFKTTQVVLSPKTVGAFVDVSRRMLIQHAGNPSIDNFIMDDLMGAIAREIDFTCLFGKGAENQPKGIYETIKETPSLLQIGSNGGLLGFNHVVDLETAIASANADKGISYLVNSKLRGYLKTKPKIDGVAGFIWEGQQANGDGLINGYYATVSNMIPGDRSKGTSKDLTSIVAGDFSSLVLGSWDILEIQINPYLDDNGIRIKALQDCDIAIRNEESFSMYEDVSLPSDTNRSLKRSNSSSSKS